MVEVHPEHAVCVSHLEPLVAGGCASEQSGVVGDSHVVPVVEALAGVVTGISVERGVEAHVRAVVVRVGHPVAVGVRAGAPVGLVHVVGVWCAVAVSVVIGVVAGAVVVSVEPLAAVEGGPVVAVVDSVSVVVGVLAVAGAVAVEV